MQFKYDVRTIVPICCVLNWIILRHLLFRILEETIFKRPDTIYQNWIMNYLWCICTLCWRFFASSFWLLVLRMNKINLALMYEWFFVMHKKNVAKKFNIILEMIWKGILLFCIGKHNVFSDDNFFLMIAWLRRYFILTYITKCNVPQKQPNSKTIAISRKNWESE